MKILKKINKGLILTIIVLLILCIYLFIVEQKRNAAKPEIEKAVTEYIELINKYAVVPNELQTLYISGTIENVEEKTKETNEKIKEHLNKYEAEIKDKMIDNKVAVDMQKERLEDFINNTYDMTLKVVTKYDKKVVKINKYKFDDDQVTVTLETKIDIETKYLNPGEEEKLQKDTNNAKYETVTLKNTDGAWKIVFADLTYKTEMYADTSYQIMY